MHTLHRDVLMLLGKYELFGTWQPQRPYLHGYVVDYEGKLYVCTESHDANAAADLGKFKAFGTASGSLTGAWCTSTMIAGRGMGCWCGRGQNKRLKFARLTVIYTCLPIKPSLGRAALKICNRVCKPPVWR